MRHRSTFTSLRTSMMWFGLSYAVAIAGYLGLNVAASRAVGPQDFGLFMVVLTATTLLGRLGLVGVNRAGLREASRLDRSDVARLAHLRGGVRSVNLVALPAVSIVAGAGAWALFRDRGAEALPLGLTTAALVYLTGQQKICASYLRGLGHLRLSNLLEGRSGGALVAVLQAGLVTVVWLTAPTARLPLALMAVAVGFAVPVAAAWIVLARAWAHAVPPSGLWRHLVGVAKRDWKFSVTQGLGFANTSVDLWICALLLPALATSEFGAAQRMAQLLLIPVTAVQVVFSPAVARMSANKDPALQRLARTGSSLTTALSSLMWLPMVIAPGALLAVVFGEGFAGAAPLLILLATAYFASSPTGPSGVTLSMSHHEGTVAMVHGTVLTLRVGVGTIAALSFGVIGLAASSMAMTMLGYLLMWLGARRKVGVNTHATLRPNLGLLTKVSG